MRPFSSEIGPLPAAPERPTETPSLSADEGDKNYGQVNGTEMVRPSVVLDQPNGVTTTKRIATRTRRPLPPPQERDWMTAKETALKLGCSVATVHRLRRGLIPGIEPLPFSQYGRKFVFRKQSVARWQDKNERGGRAQW